MAKELPYFQFEPAEYLTKDISFCSLSAQGLFINICSYYWQRQCDLSKEQFLRRFNYVNEFEELLKEGVIDIINEKIVVKFLDIQYKKATEFSKEQSRKGSLGGRPKKPKESQIKAIREDNIIKEDIKEDNKTINNKKFVDNCLESNQWLEVTCMQKRVSLEQIKKDLLEFEKHLIMQGEQKKYVDDFKTHFINWLSKKPKKENKPITHLGI